jgi:hypothetical protein
MKLLNTLTIIEIKFPSRFLRLEDVHPLEQILRAHENVDHLTVRKDTLSFFIWSQKDPGQELLEKIKDELKARGFLEFVISVTKYYKAGDTARYSRGDEINGSREEQ